MHNRTCMNINLACECGEVLNVPVSYAGRSVLCAKCNRTLVIPEAKHAPTIAEDPSLASGKGLPQATVRPPELARDENDDDTSRTRRSLKPVVDDIEVVIGPAVTEVSPAEAAASLAQEFGPSTKQLRQKETKRAANPPPPPGDPVAPASTERVKADGKEQWKVICHCGKRLLVPLDNEQPVGRCPKCNRRLQLPGSKDPSESGFITKVEDDLRLVAIGSGVDHPKVDYPPDFKPPAPVSAPAPKPRGGSERQIHLTAATTAADLLRKRKTDSAPAQKHGSDIITAWPLAGFPRRMLAAFIDLTIALCVTAGLVVLAMLEIFPELLMRPEVMLPLIPFSGFCCEAFIATLWDGSLGKVLVVIVVRNTMGFELTPPQTIWRAALKWVLMPGWVLTLIDPLERTLHDQLAGTLVLKGRIKPGVRRE